ncbi:hypothetical protein OE88DRAFT_1729577 [Heliocybe sulcata]|uniref:Uncharacterized protein n=1 Tax=Heliocybe sulcata TaxID=5364 RepID=A0A5C3MLJ5_9AGAM|nr:hypothetical protein OE88DRAFT_1729577 [Heliocybe sulcata]
MFISSHQSLESDLVSTPSAPAYLPLTGQPTRVTGSTPTHYPATGAACKTSIGGSRLLAEADCSCEQTARDRGVVCRFGGARARTVKMSPQAQAGPVTHASIIQPNHEPARVWDSIAFAPCGLAASAIECIARTLWALLAIHTLPLGMTRPLRAA